MYFQSCLKQVLVPRHLGNHAVRTHLIQRIGQGKRDGYFGISWWIWICRTAKKIERHYPVEQFVHSNRKHDTISFNLTVGSPVTATAYRLYLAQLQIAQLEFDHLGEKGICRGYKSNFASPLYMVHKAMSDWKLTRDYRALNRITVQDRYPIPHNQSLQFW